MFSTEDVRELFQAFPPPRSSPALFLASSGQGFITQDKLRDEFQGRLAQGKLVDQHSRTQLIYAQHPGVYLYKTWHMI
jgi:hypothetical protein